jgi:hypothetical protein
MSTFQPPPDGFDNALRRSRARRHRRHLLEATVGGTTLAVAAAIVLTIHAGGLATLQQEQPAGPGTAHPTAPSTTTPTLTPAPNAGETTLASGPTSGPATGPTASTIALGSTPASPTPPARSGGTFISSPLSRRTTAYSNLTPCSDTSGRQATGWCVQPGDSFTGRTGHPNTLAVSLCRLPGVGDGQANFPTSLEATFAIHTPAPADRTVWNLDAQHPGHPSPHTITVTAGQCLTWTATWEGRDNTGRDLPAGHYTLVLSINTDNVGNPNQVITQNYDYTISG